MTSVDPTMKQASDFVGFLINSNGFLCAQVANVEPRAGGIFEVTCVERRSGIGRVRYLVNGETNKVTRL